MSRQIKNFMLFFLTIGLISCSTTRSQQSSSEQIDQGYGTVDAKKSTTAISQIDIENENAGTLNWQELFQRTAGVQVSGQNKNLNIQIRAKKSMNNQGQPLFVVNNQIMGNGFDRISFIDPAMVKRISILKDAASTSSYGSRGADGVILITLK